MKQVEKVNIGGYAFTLEADAAVRAAGYIASLEAHYLQQEGGREIMDGIEERMAELLMEEGGPEGVVTLARMERVIAILGSPEVIEDESSASEKAIPPTSSASSSRSRKKLYRYPADKVIAGVCSGLAAYFKVDVALVRVLFAVLAVVVFFSAADEGVWCLAVPVLYLILWICMPVARTARQRWELRGEGATVDDIRRSVEASAADGLMASGQDSVVWNRLLRAILFCIGLGLLIVGIGGIFAGTLFLTGFRWLGLGGFFSGILQEWLSEVPVLSAGLSQVWVKVLAAATFYLPFVGMLYFGLRLLFGFRAPHWRPGLVIFVLWMICLAVLSILVISYVVAGEARPDLVTAWAAALH